MRKRYIHFLWLLVPLAGIIEMAYHSNIERSVPRDRDWEKAAEIIEQGIQTDDIVVISPWWATQGWKWLGRFMTVQKMSRDDDVGYGRIWEVSLSGRNNKEYAKTGKLLSMEKTGRLQVRLYQFPEAPKNLYDFVEGLERDAMVAMAPDGGLPHEPCNFKLNPATGLVPNAAVQSGKFKCDPRLPWNYVAREVIADLDNKPRLCIWAHPIDGKRVHIEFKDIPDGNFIVGYTSLKYEADRETAGKPPIFLDVIVDGKTIGTAMHEEGGGWTPYKFEVGNEGIRGRVAFEVHSSYCGMAHFCFSAKLRDK